MAINDYIKELVVEKSLKGKIRKFEVYCPYKKIPALMNSYNKKCRDCKKQDPKTIVVVSGNPPYILTGDYFGCGVPTELNIYYEEGKPQLKQSVSSNNSSVNLLNLNYGKQKREDKKPYRDKTRERWLK